MPTNKKATAKKSSTKKSSTKKTAAKKTVATKTTKKAASKTAAPKKAAAKKPAKKKAVAAKTVKADAPVQQTQQQDDVLSARVELSPLMKRKMIEETAYFLSQKRGFGSGTEANDWFVAEQLVEQQLRGRFQA